MLLGAFDADRPGLRAALPLRPDQSRGRGAVRPRGGPVAGQRGDRNPAVGAGQRRRLLHRPRPGHRRRAAHDRRASRAIEQDLRARPWRPDLERRRPAHARGERRPGSPIGAPPHHPRPYVRFTPPAADPTITIEAAPAATRRTWCWTGCGSASSRPTSHRSSWRRRTSRARSCRRGSCSVDGAFRDVVLRHCTLDPGGEQARVDPLQCVPIPAITLEIRGQVDRLLIDRCITGPILEATTTGDPCSARDIVICDSIVHSLDPAVPAISSRIAAVQLERVTVFGDVVVNRLYATEALIQGTVRVTDNQTGCFRFSATDAASRPPPAAAVRIRTCWRQRSPTTSSSRGASAIPATPSSDPPRRSRSSAAARTARRSACSIAACCRSCRRTSRARSPNTCRSA